MRRLVERFFENYEAQWEIFMVVLAVFFIIIGFLPDLFPFTDSELEVLDNIDLGITIFFALEFAVRISVAPSRKGYLKEHWLDLVAIVPFVRWLRVIRILRVLRILRIMRLFRFFNALDYFKITFARFARLNGLQWMMLALTGIMFATSAFLFFFEHGVNDKVQTYWDALYASLVTWTTPGYGDVIPLTPEGRMAGLILIITGLITWGLLIANLSAFLATRRVEKRAQDPAVVDLQNKLAKLDQLNANELTCLRGAVTALIDSKLDKPKK